MGQVILTDSIEDASISVTSGGSQLTNPKLLKRRDLRANAFDPTVAGSGNIVWEMDYGSSKDVDSVFLGNLTSSNNITIEFDIWTGSAWATVETVASATYTAEHVFIDVSPSQSATKFRLSLKPVLGSLTYSLSCIFLGEKYTFPWSYEFDNNRITELRSRWLFDSAGYPVGHVQDSTEKRVWDIRFRLRDNDVTSIETEMAKCSYGKPFVFQDTNIDNSYRLVRQDNPGRLENIALAANVFELPIRLSEL